MVSTGSLSPRPFTSPASPSSTAAWTQPALRQCDRERDGAEDVLKRAEASIAARRKEAELQRLAELSKQKQVETQLRITAEVVECDPSPENVKELERALAHAEKRKVLPELRVKSRRLLAKCNRTNKHIEGVETRLQNLIRQLNDVLREKQGSDLDELKTHSSSSSTKAKVEVSRQRRQELLEMKLISTLDEARLLGIPMEAVDSAIDLIEELAERRQAEKTIARRIESLMREDDAEKLSELLLEAKDFALAAGGEAKKALEGLLGHVMRKAEREQLEHWLLSELSTAASEGDVQKLKLLFTQADSLKLSVPPEFRVLLHQLQVEVPTTANSSISSTSKLSRISRHSKESSDEIPDFCKRQLECATAALEEAEQAPDETRIDMARQAIARSKQTKVPSKLIVYLERRLGDLERIHLPRLAAEKELKKLIDASEDAISSPLDQPEQLLNEDDKVQQLKDVLREAKRWKADEVLIEEAKEILARSLKEQCLRRSAGEDLRQAMARSGRTQADLEHLQHAVESCHNCGVDTLPAERELWRHRETQVNRESAEAELAEAAKGLRAQGRIRLEEALHAAKGVGVSAEKLRAGSARLAELERHERRCALLAGNVRRILPVLKSEPWRFQQLLEVARTLQPWTAELQHWVREGEELMKKAREEEQKNREIRSRLQNHLHKIEELQSKGEPTRDLLASLPPLLEKAKVAGVTDEILRRGWQHIRDQKREGCQRIVAEHRLRLALSARDAAEIDRSLRQVRALSTGDPTPGKADKTPKTARLTETAHATFRQLSDASNRRQTATALLVSHIADDAEVALHFELARRNAVGLPDVSQSIPTELPLEGLQLWIQRAQEALQEAKQSGVAPTLIEQAKLKIAQKKREREGRFAATKGLKELLTKEDAPEQEIAAKMARVKRFIRPSLKIRD